MPGSPSAPASTARPAAACARWRRWRIAGRGASSISAPAPASWRWRRRGCCTGRCSATDIEPWSVRVARRERGGATASGGWCGRRWPMAGAAAAVRARRALRPGVRQHPGAAALRMARDLAAHLAPGGTAILAGCWIGRRAWCWRRIGGRAWCWSGCNRGRLDDAGAAPMDDPRAPGSAPAAVWDNRRLIETEACGSHAHMDRFQQASDEERPGCDQYGRIGA